MTRCANKSNFTVYYRLGYYRWCYLSDPNSRLWHIGTSVYLWYQTVIEIEQKIVSRWISCLKDDSDDPCHLIIYFHFFLKKNCCQYNTCNTQKNRRFWTKRIFLSPPSSSHFQLSHAQKVSLSLVDTMWPDNSTFWVKDSFVVVSYFGKSVQTE